MTQVELCRDWYPVVALSRAGSFPVFRQLAMGFAVVVLLVGLNLYAPAHPSVMQRVLASAIIALASLPVFLWRLGVDRNIPFVPLIAGVFIAHFALPIFILQRYSHGIFGRTVSDDVITAALALSLVGFSCMLAGYYGPAHLLLERFVPHAKLGWTDERALRNWAVAFAGFGVFIWLFGAASRGPSSFGQVAMFSADLWMIAIAILFGLQLAGRLGAAGKLTLWGVLVPSRLALGVITGATAQGMVVGVLLVMLYASIRRRIPWTVVALGGLVFFIVRPVQAPFRGATWQGGVMQQASTADKMELFSNLMMRAVTEDSRGRDFLVQFATHRLSQISVFAEVIRDTPDHVPYWNGASYRPLMFKLIPRFIYRNKPVDTSGSNFGHRYGFIDVSNYWTAINLPQLVELYANFGAMGIVIGMFVIGLVYRMVFSVFVHPAMGFGGVIASVYLCTKLVDIGSGTSLVFGGLPWVFVFVALIHLAISASPLGRHPQWSAVPGN
jgi:hypothetical protein